MPGTIPPPPSLQSGEEMISFLHETLAQLLGKFRDAANQIWAKLPADGQEEAMAKVDFLHRAADVLENKMPKFLKDVQGTLLEYRLGCLSDDTDTDECLLLADLVISIAENNTGKDEMVSLVKDIGNLLPKDVGESIQQVLLLLDTQISHFYGQLEADMNSGVRGRFYITYSARAGRACQLAILQNYFEILKSFKGQINLSDATALLSNAVVTNFFSNFPFSSGAEVFLKPDEVNSFGAKVIGKWGNPRVKMEDFIKYKARVFLNEILIFEPQIEDVSKVTEQEVSVVIENSGRNADAAE